MAALRLRRCGALSAVLGTILLSTVHPAAAERSWQPPNPSGMNGVEAGAPALDPATLHSIGIRWPVRGDDNGDAAIAVAYRLAGTTEWRIGYPLFWIHPERQPAQYRVPGGRLFAGSIVGLEPGQTYEIRLDLTDPDGGLATERLMAATRPVPVPPPGMRTRHVVPGDGAGGNGSADNPFQGLERALSQAEPGDLFLLRAGVYGVGHLQMRASGTEAKPIIIRGESKQSVFLDGGDADVGLDLTDRTDVWLEDVTLQNARVLLRAERAKRIVVRGNDFHILFLRGATGIEAFQATTQHFVITDNRFLGPNTSWPMTYRGKKTPELSNGITIAGSGHDIAYNEISHVGDGINSGQIIDHNPPGEGLSATDMYNNEIYETRTECIEADHSLTNIRIYNNRLTNCLYGVSTQPAMGGPVYIFRNMIYNTSLGPLKLHNHTSGVLIFHNTSIRAGIPFLIQPGRETVNDVITRNNLFIGTRAPAIRATGRMIRSDFDNDAFFYGMNGSFALWNGATYASPQRARNAQVIYWERGPIMLMGMRGFENAPLPPSGDVVPQPREDNRPLLNERSRALDKAIALPNFNDTFVGEAPDLGCCELGQPLPHVGPRTDWRG